MKIFSATLYIAGIFAPCCVAYEAECHLPLDVMFLQDTTGSFDEDLPNVVNQIPNMLRDISRVHPNSRFGVAEFHDKPFYPLGIQSDFCYKIGGPLTNSTAEFRDAYSLLYASGGSDLPEASYHALINVLEDEAVGWRPLASSRAAAADPSVSGARVVIMSTDAVPHLPNDYLNMYNHDSYPELPAYLPPHSGSPHPVQNGDIDWQCTAQDYPSPDQVRAAYLRNLAYLVILTPEDPAITGAWQWVNRDLFQQPDGFYQYIKADSSNLLEGVLNALEAVTATACATTTPEPTTTTTTTKARPTVQSTMQATSSHASSTTRTSPTTPRVSSTIKTSSTTESTELSSSTTEISLESTSAELIGSTTLPERLPAEDSTTLALSTAAMSSVVTAATAEDAIPTVGALTLTLAPPTVAVLTPSTEGVPTIAALSSPTTPATSTLLSRESSTPVPSSSMASTTESSTFTTRAVADATSETTSSSDRDDCCPHVEIKMMQAPKQWKMMVVN